MEEYYECIEEFKDNGSGDTRYGKLGEIYKRKQSVSNSSSSLKLLIDNEVFVVSSYRFKKVDGPEKTINNYKFKVGDVVKINSTSVFYNISSDHNPINTKGIISQIINDDLNNFIYRVMWTSGSTNIYAERDLVLFDENNKEESLLDKAKRLYPIGTKVKSAVGSNIVHIIKSKPRRPVRSIFADSDQKTCCIYDRDNNKWAEIINELESSIESSPVVPNVNTNSNFINPSLHVFDKKENLIEPVHSINVKLRTKKTKFKY